MNILEKIVATKKEEVNSLKKIFSKKDFQDSPFFAQSSLSFRSAISKVGSLNLIAEIKKASPSKGIIRNNYNHIEIANIYFSSSIDAVSILTDEKYFQGSISYLNEIAVIKESPLLRKDFIINELQVFESKANGADAILLIAEILSRSEIKEFTLLANEINLEVLLEIHSAKQLDKIDFSVNKIIGVNNRNLETFEVSLNTTFEIAVNIPKDCLIVSESGISNHNDIEKLKQANINAVLVGEHFMKSDNIKYSIQEFKRWCQYES